MTSAPRLPIPGILLVLACAGCSTRPEVLPAHPIPGLRHQAAVHDGVSAAGQPSRDQLRAARDLGYRTIVNLRAQDEDPIVAAERHWAAELGLRYVQIQVREPDDLRGDGPRRLGTLLEDFRHYPILLHDLTGDRSAALYAVYQGRHRGRSVEEALERGRAAGLRDPHWVAAVERALAAAPRHPSPAARR